jgi:hypothetical protein
MKFTMAFGALAGFALGILCGLTAATSWQRIVVHASASAVGLAFLMRWWRRVWIRSLGEARTQQALAAQKAQRDESHPQKGAKV